MGEYEHRGWTVPYWNDEIAEWQGDQLFASDALLLGRVTYEEFVASWPLRSGDPFTDRINICRNSSPRRPCPSPSSGTPGSSRATWSMRSPG